MCPDAESTVTFDAIRRYQSAPASKPVTHLQVAPTHASPIKEAPSSTEFPGDDGNRFAPATVIAWALQLRVDTTNTAVDFWPAAPRNHNQGRPMKTLHLLAHGVFVEVPLWRTDRLFCRLVGRFVSIDLLLGVSPSRSPQAAVIRGCRARLREYRDRR